MKSHNCWTQALIFSAFLVMSACGPHSSEDTPSKDRDIRFQEATIGEPCSRSASQPTTCSYGEYCASIPSQCSAVPAAVCDNFSNHGTTWDPSTSTGPVIYDAKVVRFAQDTTFCSTYAPKRVTFRLKVYAPAADLPTSTEGFSGRFYFVSPDGVEINASALQRITTTSDRKNVTFDVNLCLPDGTTSYTAGFFFVGGSEVCVTASEVPVGDPATLR
ncbi:hypothetical protein JYK02_07190 [Corallococcus macrosporus]|uniref:Lipoprotein n=1 Tax=Corallococcus macrosporus TaxID=35 RepID=A0ABS3D6L3_9BACT|nr:hypothetical protein [Corallococcus macrosporus]MBN8227294.1 hypothetical protein [Corallococcus macrosporus]